MLQKQNNDFASKCIKHCEKIIKKNESKVKISLKLHNLLVDWGNEKCNDKLENFAQRP